LHEGQLPRSRTPSARRKARPARTRGRPAPRHSLRAGTPDSCGSANWSRPARRRPPVPRTPWKAPPTRRKRPPRGRQARPRRSPHRRSGPRAGCPRPARRQHRRWSGPPVPSRRTARPPVGSLRPHRDGRAPRAPRQSRVRESRRARCSSRADRGAHASGPTGPHRSPSLPRSVQRDRATTRQAAPRPSGGTARQVTKPASADNNPSTPWMRPPGSAGRSPGHPRRSAGRGEPRGAGPVPGRATRHQWRRAATTGLPAPARRRPPRRETARAATVRYQRPARTPPRSRPHTAAAARPANPDRHRPQR
jgi:hypothetical protein